MIDRFSVYFGIIASWLSIFAVLDQFCSQEIKSILKNYLSGVASNAKSWLHNFFDAFEQIFPSNNLFISILNFSLSIFVAFSFFALFLDKLSLEELLISLDSLIACYIILRISYWFSSKKPFTYYGVGFNNYKQFYLGTVVGSVLGIAFLFLTLPVSIHNDDSYNNILIAIGFLLVVNFISNYLAILITKWHIKRIINKHQSISLTIFVDLILKVIIYLISLLISLILLHYNTRTLNIIPMLFSLHDRQFNFSVYFVISFYSTLFSSIWLIISLMINKMSYLVNKIKDIFEKYSRYIKNDQVFTIIGVATLPFFMIAILILDQLT